MNKRARHLNDDGTVELSILFSPAEAHYLTCEVKGEACEFSKGYQRVLRYRIRTKLDAAHLLCKRVQIHAPHIWDPFVDVRWMHEGGPGRLEWERDKAHSAGDLARVVEIDAEIKEWKRARREKYRTRVPD